MIEVAKQKQIVMTTGNTFDGHRKIQIWKRLPKNKNIWKQAGCILFMLLWIDILIPYVKPKT